MTSVEDSQTSVTETEKEVKDYLTLSLEIDEVIKSNLENLKQLKSIKKELDKTHARELKNSKEKEI